MYVYVCICINIYIYVCIYIYIYILGQANKAPAQATYKIPLMHFRCVCVCAFSDATCKQIHPYEFNLCLALCLCLSQQHLQRRLTVELWKQIFKRNIFPYSPIDLFVYIMSYSLIARLIYVHILSNRPHHVGTYSSVVIRTYQIHRILINLKSSYM